MRSAVAFHYHASELIARQPRRHKGSAGNPESAGALVDDVGLATDAMQSDLPREPRLAAIVTVRARL